MHSEKLPDPFVDRNDLQARWVEEVDWALKAEFEISEEMASNEAGLLLVLDSIDCYAEVLLNQTRVGSIDNQFREHRFPLDEMIPGFTNELIIYMRSAKLVTAALERVHGKLPAGFDSARVHARRCQCLTGWDWAARLSSVSMTTPPRIEVDAPFRLVTPFVYARDITPVSYGSSATDQATLSIEVILQAQRRVRGKVTMRLFDPTGQQLKEMEIPVRGIPGANSVRAVAKIENASLWWPIGIGETPRYSAEFELQAQDRAGNQVSAAKATTTFGIRTVALDKKKDTEGETFVLNVNGHPVFCRGANWIPVSMLAAQHKEEDYRLLLSAAAAAGMNCLRVWGGGIYETEAFYEMCDRLGILIWQDFMFACAAYPTYREFLDEVEAEAEYQIWRLRCHPSVAIWCGNNENEWLHQVGGLRKGVERRIIGEEIWARLLKDRADEFDPSRPYVQSSPFGRNREDFNDQHSGDRHSWDVWGNWRSANEYLRDTGRFISEFGFQSLPDVTSIGELAHRSQDFDSIDLAHHQYSPEGFPRLARYLSEMFVLPQSLEEWIDGTQRLQAEVLRRGVEHWRRRKFATAGTLIWQLHDAFTAVSWSLIDYYRRPKYAYHSSARFFSPVLLSASLEEDGRTVASFAPVNDQPEGVVSFTIHGTDKPPTAELGPQRGISVMLINDSAFLLRGQIKLYRNGEADPCFEQPLEVPPNTKSEPLRKTLEELEITDVTAQWLRAELVPDDDTRARLENMSETITSRIHALGPVEDMPDAFRRHSCYPALSADVLFVEPKYFRWTDDIVIFGKTRPSWQENPI